MLNIRILQEHNDWWIRITLGSVSITLMQYVAYQPIDPAAPVKSDPTHAAISLLKIKLRPETSSPAVHCFGKALIHSDFIP